MRTATVANPPRRFRQAYRKDTLLEGHDTTYPLVSREGVVAFWRNRELALIDDRMERHVIHSDPPTAEEGVLSRMLLSPWGSLVFAIDHEVRVVDAGLGSLAQSPWPCGGGNPLKNPVWAAFRSDGDSRQGARS